MGIESRDIPAGLGAGVRALFLKTIETVPSHYDKLAMVLPSRKSEERYAWLSSIPGMREFVDERQPAGGDFLAGVCEAWEREARAATDLGMRVVLLRTGVVLDPDGGALKIARKGVGTFEVVVHGRAAHAGLEPEKGVNALLAAAELITHIATFGDPATATTVTPTVAVAGTVENVVPAQARVKVDVRVEQPGEKERLEGLFASLVTSVPGATIEVLGGINRPPMPATASATLFPVAVAAAAAAGLGEVRGVGVGGGSDGNFTAARGVPTLDGLGAVGGGAHADHEFVLVDTMVARAQLLAALIDRL